MTSADPEEARRTAAHAFARGALIEARKAAVTAGTEAIKLVAALNAGGVPESHLRAGRIHHTDVVVRCWART
jgi:hypothetical protein